MSNQDLALLLADLRELPSRVAQLQDFLRANPDYIEQLRDDLTVFEDSIENIEQEAEDASEEDQES